MTDIISSLNWRYATKKYDPSKKINADDLETLKEATRLSVSSMGLQPYRVLVVETPEIREKLKKAAYGRDSMTDASHVFVFAVEKNIGGKQIEAYLKNISATRAISLESLDGFNKMMHNFVDGMSAIDKDAWSKKQAYIALATLISTASILRIDATPMEGFDADAFDEILGLENLGLTTAVIATVGYRHQDDATQHHVKVRKAKEELFINL